MDQIQDMPVALLATTKQVRTSFDEGTTRGLAQSLREVGLLQPIRVRPIDDKYFVVDGERRLGAAKLLGWQTIAAIVEEKPLSEAEIVQRQWIANCQRDCLSAGDKARAIQSLMGATGWPAADTAKKLGLSAASLSRTLAILTLPPDIQKKIDDGLVPASAGYELSRIADPGKQAELAERLAGGSLTRDGVAAVRKSEKPSREAVPKSRIARGTAVLGPGRSVTVTAGELSLESFIAILEELLAKARKARPQALELRTFLTMLRDQSKS